MYYVENIPKNDLHIVVMRSICVGRARSAPTATSVIGQPTTILNPHPPSMRGNINGVQTEFMLEGLRRLALLQIMYIVG